MGVAVDEWRVVGRKERFGKQNLEQALILYPEASAVHPALAISFKIAKT